MDINAIPTAPAKSESNNLASSVEVVGNNLVITVPLTFSSEYVKASNTDKAVPMVTVVPKSSDPNHVGQLYIDATVTQGEASKGVKLRLAPFSMFIAVPRKK